MLTVLVGTAFILAGCGNPFQIGLGDDVDLNTPDVSINTGQLYLSGTEVFTGTFTDDFAVAAVDLSFDGGSTFLPASLNQANRTWSISVNTATYPDGENYVQVRVTDTSGKQITKQALFYIDNRAPLVVVTTPINITTPEALDAPPYSNVAFSGVYNGNVQIKGEAGDQFGIDSVEYQILDDTGSVIPGYDWSSSGVDGTNSWSFTIDTTDSALGAGATATLQVSVRATDRAGNVSSGVMHADAVVANNGGNPISVEALVGVVNGTLTGPTITPELITDITATKIDLDIDQSADLPTFTISNPDENSTIDDNVLSSAPRFTGTVEDDSEGVDPSTIQFMVTRTSGTGTLPSWVGNWTDVTGTTGTGLLVRWTADVTGLLDGDYEFQVRASDLGTTPAQGTSSAVAFRVDTGAPTVVVTSPAQGSYHNSSFTLAGTATDGQGISYVNVSVDDGSSWIPAAVTPAGGNDYDWTVDIDPDGLSMPEGATTIKIEANDGISTSNFNIQVIIDRVAPSASFLTPADGTTVNETVVVQGTASDDNIVTLVEMSIDGAAFFALPGLYTWNRSIDTTSYGSGDLTIDVRVTDIAGNTYTTSGYNLVVDQSQDLPTVTFVSPTAGQRVGGSLNVSGTASDDDGVVVVRMQLDLNDDGDYDDEVNLNGDGDTDDPYEHEYQIYDLTGTTLWSTTLNSGGELYGADGGTGNVTIMVWAEDDHVVGTPQERSVQFDAGAPVVTVTSPSQGSYQNDTFNVAGTAVDANGVTDVDVSVDGGSSWMPATIAGSAPNFTWDVDIDPVAEGLSDGSLTIMIQATDGTSTSDVNLQVVIDTEDPTASFISPAASSSVNGEVIIRGISSDNTQISLVELRIGDNDSYFTLSDQYYNWEYTIDSTAYATEPHATETPPGSSVWLLNVTARVTDIAGNQYETSGYYFMVDNDLDKPTVTFVSPSPGQRIGGPVTVTGTAFDDDAIDFVEMRLDANGDGDYDDQIDFDGTPGTTGMFEDETVWNTLSGTTLWSQDLNNSGELYETEPGHDGTITIQARAQDIYGTVGNTVELTVVFDDTIPRVENMSHTSSDYVRGQFTFTADVFDDEEVRSIRISYNGGQDYVDLVLNGIVQEPTMVTQNAIDDYDLSVDIDTETTLPGLSAPIDSGILYLRVRVDDYAGYQSLAYINLNVDNLYPTGDWDTGSVDPQEIDGTSALVQGTAEDTGTVGGFGAAYVYFTRSSGTVLLHPDGVVHGGLTTADFDDGSTVGVTDITSFPYPASALDIIRIDDDNEFGLDGGGNGDGDGYNEEITLSAGEYTWWAEFDSTNISDGELEIHYVIFDESGNATHYETAGFIKNERPQIDLLTVGTDLDFSGTVEGDETQEYSAALQARQLLYVNIDASDPLSIPAIPADGYEVFLRYSENWDSGTLPADTPMDGVVGPTVSGTSYDSGRSIDLSLFDEGDTIEFYAQVTDDSGITVQSYFSVVIDNEDDTNPEIDFDLITSPGSVVAGHVEAATESSFDNGTGNDADVSGTIVLTGQIRDDQRVQNVYLAIDGYDFGGLVTAGNECLIAAWDNDADELLSEIGGDLILTPSWSVEDGHTVDFEFTWNSAEITGSADTDVSIAFRVEDFGSTTVDATADTTVDVVPYITDLEIGLESGTLSYLQRSAQGAYPIAYSDSGADTFIINGYNLNMTAGSVAIGATTLTVESSDTTDYFWVEVRKDSTNSGDLTVTVSGVDSINNVNNNALSQNSEATTYYPDQSDDRVMAVWDLNSRTTWTGLTEPVMRPNATRTGMDWLGVSNGQSLMFNGATQLTYSWSLLGGDMWRNGDGTLMWIFLHNMNWSSGATTYPYFGSVQWGKDAAPEAAAYNWHRANTDRLGIGNLSFGGDGNYTYTDSVMHRYTNLRIIATGDDGETDNFVAYFDTASESRSIVFWSFKTGDSLAPADQVTGMAGGWDSNLQKYTDGNTGQNYSSATNLDVGLRTPYTGIARTEVTSGGADSESFSIAWDETNGILYLAYYDESQGELRLAYNLDPVNTPGAWTVRATPIDSGAGLYNEMVVDPDGGIHIAYFDSNESNLRYAYLSAYDVADVDVETYTVDALFTNGMYNSIAIRDFSGGAGTDYRPVISTFSLSYSGTRYALRAAWPMSALGALADGANDATGAYTGDWEVVAVPAATPPAQSRTFIETDGATVTQGQIVVGYNGGWIEEATLLDE